MSHDGHVHPNPPTQEDVALVQYWADILMEIIQVDIPAATN